MIKTVESGNDIYSVASDSLCIDIKKNNLNAYPVNIRFPSSKAYTERQIGIIDSGAANTAITIKALWGDIDDTQYQIIMSAADIAEAYTRNFSSVKGKDDVKGILCIIPEIKIDDMLIRDFPFFLIDDRETARVLLGYDFISSCDIVQIKDQSMSFYNYNLILMKSKMFGTKALHLLSLSI